MSIAYEHQQLAALISAHRATLFQAQLKQAKLGSAAPEYLANEIAAIEAEIERLSERPVEMTPREAHLVNYQMWMRLETNQVELAREMRELRQRVNQLIDALAMTATHTRGRPARRTNGA